MAQLHPKPACMWHARFSQPFTPEGAYTPHSTEHNVLHSELLPQTSKEVRIMSSQSPAREKTARSGLRMA
eukprot:1180993-Prorocentrum_minimum.AAC.1